MSARSEIARHTPRGDSILMNRQSRNSAKGRAIHFGDNVLDEPVHWVATSALYHYAVGNNPTESAEHRIMAHAMLRMNFDGVAVFKRQELARLCSQVNRKTGELRPMRADPLNRAIRRLVEKGFVHPESWSRVVYVHIQVAQNGQGRTAPRAAIPRKPGFNGAPAPQYGQEVEPC